MAVDPWGFLTYRREDALVRPVGERIRDWRVVIEAPAGRVIERNATRCMDCGVAFCELGCPLGNEIAYWNDSVASGRWQYAIEQLHATNNFPEFTGWLCPAPCEASCVLAINDDAVAIRQIELAIIDRAFAEGWVVPHPPDHATGFSVAVVGSGPAGLAAAQQLTRAGHEVAVFERADRVGGLLRYGIPDFKMDKALLDRRLEQLSAEGTQFHTQVDVGGDLTADELVDSFDAAIVACGSSFARQLDVPGANLVGVHQGMTYLEEANRVQAGDQNHTSIDAAGRHVAIIGGGDTGLDCLGTANRQGAASVRMFDHNPCPPSERDFSTNPWPQWPRVHKHGFAQEEGVREEWRTEVRQLVPDQTGRVHGICGDRVDAVWEQHHRRFESIGGSAFQVRADLVLLAMGFDGVEAGRLVRDLEIDLTGHGTIAIDDDWQTTAPGVYACGDATRGASLVVWAIADGRACAAAVHANLTGEDTLPRPVAPSDHPL